MRRLIDINIYEKQREEDPSLETYIGMRSPGMMYEMNSDKYPTFDILGLYQEFLDRYYPMHMTGDPYDEGCLDAYVEVKLWLEKLLKEQ